MNKNSKILLLGASGLIGQQLLNELADYPNVFAPSSKELDLRNEKDVNAYFKEHRPEYVFLVAAFKSGVAEYSKYPVEFLEYNLRIELNVIHSSFEFHVKKLEFVGASCIYPESQDLLVNEDFFAAGWVQKATEPYALAKAVGTKLCDYYNKQFNTSYVTAALSNIYGWCDKQHYDKTSVVPAMIERFQTAVDDGQAEVRIWGTGENKREFLYVKDCAKALITIMESDITGIVNVGSGKMVTINELAETVAGIVGYTGKIEHDLTKPEGSKRSVLDIGRLSDLGWRQQYSLKQGLEEMIKNRKGEKDEQGK